MDKQLILDAYHQMLRIRRVEERIAKEYIENNIRSFVHFYVGQEAIAVGVCMNLSKEDYVFGNHRSHGHYLAKGGDLKKLIAELYGKETGCCGGRGGSMHLIDKNAGFIGSISILGSIIPIAVGAAFVAKKRGENRKCVVFIGDGAMEEGVFYESINFASLFKIPILFAVENNLYAVMSNKKARRPESFDLSKVVNGLGADYYVTDGNYFPSVYDVTNLVLKEISETMRPAVIEFMTYRHMAHSGPVFDDNVGYRKMDTKEVRERNCPLKNLKSEISTWGSNELFKAFWMNALYKMELKVELEIDEAIRFAEESPFPKPEDILKDVYYE